jgi:hypothetical protein
MAEQLEQTRRIGNPLNSADGAVAGDVPNLNPPVETSVFGALFLYFGNNTTIDNNVHRF